MIFSRSNPSPRYRELLEQYHAMHDQGECFLGIPPQETFPGLSLPPQAGRIKRLIEKTEACTLLDYGSGKGQQYDTQGFNAPDGERYESILDYWDVVGVHCYDPCYPPYVTLPQGRFDGVISTDVLEHCPETDIPWIVDEIFAFAEFFVFANVACYPARKRLPNGENAHSTIRPVEWWHEILNSVASKYPAVTWEVWVQSVMEMPDGNRIGETRLGNEEL